MAPPPDILVVDDDPRLRGLVRSALELEGARVIVAESVGQARALLAERLDGVVLDRQLPDGDGTDLIPEIRRRHPGAVIVVHSAVGGPVEASHGAVSVTKGDVDGLLSALGLPAAGESPARRLAAPQAVRAQASELAATWAELCRWDPSLPPDAEPAVADGLIAAVAAAMEHPQPLGWGLDPALDAAAEAFALNTGRPDVALAQLICLRQAFHLTVLHGLPADEQPEAEQRLTMIVERTMLVAVQLITAELQRQALNDALTGLPNRRAFERDLRSEVARAERHGHALTVAVVDLDGLKRINDREGHAAGDAALRALATALVAAARREDRAYRIGGDEFALILVDAAVVDGRAIRRRLDEVGAPACSLGIASHPPVAPDDLFVAADRDLYAGRRARPGARPRSA